MRLFAKKSQTPELTVADLAAQLEHFRERDAFYLLTLRALLYCMKEFSLDLVEIEAAQFKERMDGLTHALLSDLSVAKLHRAFARSKDDILSYIEREKLYFRDRENEFKHIIALLSTGLTTLTRESQDFHTQLYAHSTRLENITYLDDLRQLKEALRREVEQIKVQIRDKQARDTAHVAALSREVNTLRVDVEHAQTAARTDGLTGACNRAAFDVCLCQAVERHTVTPSPFALLLIDIDNFKRINDTYGHQVGDRVLIALGYGQE